MIGISTYDSLPADDQLHFAHRDAQSFADLLTSRLGGSVPGADIKLLVERDATRVRILSWLRWLGETAREGDEIIIYFAGHGVQENSRPPRRTYLLAADATRDGIVEINGVDFPTFGLYVQRMRVGGARVVVIADACHAGGMGAETQLEQKIWKTDSLETADAPLTELLASSNNQPSQESDQWGSGHGVFTYYLLEGWRGKAAEKTGLLSMGDLFRFVRDSVMAAAKAGAQRQTPGFLGALQDTVWRTTPESLLVLLRDSTQELQVATLAGSQASTGHGLAAARGPQETASVTRRGMGPDVHALVAAFEGAIASRHLLRPRGGSAWDFYARLQRAVAAGPVIPELARELEIALEIDAERVIRRYLHGGSDQREALSPGGALPSDSAFGEAADELRHALTLLPSDDPTRQSMTAEVRFLEGYVIVRRLDAKRYSVAKRLLRQSIELEPQAAYAYNALGLLYWRLEALDSAADLFQRAIDRAGSWAFPRANLAGVDADRGRHDLALQEFQAALTADSLSTYAYNQLGNEYVLLGRYAAAERAYKRSVSINPTYAIGWSNLAFISRLEAHYREAQADLDRALKYSRSDTLGAAKYWLATEGGRLSRDMGDLATAVMDFRQAATLMPFSPDPLDDLGDTYLLFGSDSAERAAMAYRHAIELDTLDERAYEGLATAEEYVPSAGRAAAEEDLRTLLRRRPVATAPRLYLGDYYVRIGQQSSSSPDRTRNFDSAGVWYERARQLDTLSGVVYERLGELSTLRGDWRSAEQFFRDWAALTPSSPVAMDSLGVLFRRRAFVEPRYARDWTDSAMAAFRQSIGIDSEYPAPYNEIGRIDLELGLIDSALATFGRASRSTANALSPSAYAADFALRAEASLDSGNTDIALVAYRAARAMSPPDVWVLGEMAQTFYMTGRATDALTYVDSLTATLPSAADDAMRRSALLRARALVDANDAASALATLHSLEKSNDARDAVLHLTEALAYGSTGDKQAAAASYALASRLAGAQALDDVIVHNFSPRDREVLHDLAASTSNR